MKPPSPVQADEGGDRCQNPRCRKPDESRFFYEVEEGLSAGNQDWSSLYGNVLCEACYEHFRRKGTLDRSSKKAPIEEHLRRCGYEGCLAPESSGQYVRIDQDTVAGKRDWTPHQGKILCEACYKRFQRNGTLDPIGPSKRKNATANSQTASGRGTPRARAAGASSSNSPSPSIKSKDGSQRDPESPMPSMSSRTGSSASGAQGESQRTHAAVLPPLSQAVGQHTWWPAGGAGVVGVALCRRCGVGEASVRVVPCGCLAFCDRCEGASTRARVSQWQDACPVCGRESAAPHVARAEEYEALEAIARLRTQDYREGGLDG